jgi:internalin A
MIKKYNQYLKENNDYSDIDPYGEEIWDDDELNPILYIAKQQGRPYEQIIELNCSYKKLNNLDGIQIMINLRRLDCYNNRLTSLEGIEKLTNLISLDCSRNDLTNLNEIEKLSNIQELWCNSNDLTNLNGIENLIHLGVLSCLNNNFSKDYEKYIKQYCRKKKIKLIL